MEDLEREQLSGREKYQQKKEEKEKARERERKGRQLKRVLKITILSLIFIGGISGFIWFLFTKPVSPEPEIIARQGIHWHADLGIKILDKYQEIPANIGIGITERYIHTHQPDGVIHMEFPGLVRRDDIRLGRFFEIWGKKFSKDCIFDECSGPEGQLKMLVNGKENFEFGNYLMRDGDKIEIIFE